MFKVFEGERKRQVLTPRTIALSVGAHVFLLLPAVIVLESGATATPKPIEDITYFETKAPPPPPKPVEVKPQSPEQPAPRRGDYVNPLPPERVPTEIPEVNPRELPVTVVPNPGIGEEGDIVGPRTGGEPTPLTGNPNRGGDGTGDETYVMEMVEELPELENRAETQRLLQRAYPPLLRDAGVGGRTMVEMVIDKDGRVVPGSVKVQESTHESFRDAAVRVAEKLRFRPAKLGGMPVKVLISLPIDWRLQR